jgi:hypothetical protein
MKFLSAAILVCLVAACLANEKTSYKGYKLIRVYPNNAADMKFIQKMESVDPELDVWHGDIDGTDVMLSPKNIRTYLGLFKSRNMKFEVVQQDVQAVIEQQEESMRAQAKDAKNIIHTYARHTAINNFIDEIVDRFPNASRATLVATTYEIGRTLENRALKVLRLKTPSTTRSIWIDCGIHAREWASPATCVSFTDRIINEYLAGVPAITALMNKYEFHILPVLNPDGYEFSHTTTRLWRKNRKVNTGSTCLGVDLNRNSNFQWNPNNGASPLPCSEVFSGPSGGSELETQALARAINARLGNWDAYLSIHTYGNYWLSSWGYTPVPPTNNAALQAAAKVGVDAIRATHGQNFVAGPSSTTLYATSGSTTDWTYGVANIAYSYVLELRPGPGTPDYSFGFQLPVDRMPQVSNETYNGIIAFLGHVSANPL